MPLPLHLCQVLEEEYAVLHAQPTDVPSWDFDETHFFTVDAERTARPGQISPAAELLALVCPDLGPELRSFPGRPESLSSERSADGVGARERWTCVDPHSPFSSHLAALVRRRPASAVAPGTPARRLAQLLNGILDSPDLFEQPALVGTMCRKETEQLCAARLARRELGGADLRRFNRLLLEDAYPRVIKRIYDVRLTNIIARIHEVPGPPRAALCLSGGGIRSGTFALGVLQGMARHDLLRHFHYLSTVSGGGYVGSWFTAWCHRHPKGLDGVSAELRELRSFKKVEPEPEPVRRLREYSNFVAIRPHLLSADVWSFIAIYLRNILINWLVFIPLILAVLLGPRIAVALLYVDPAERWTLPWRLVGGTVQGALLGLGFALSIAAIFYVTINRPSLEDLLARSRFWYGRRTQGHVLAFSVLPTIASGLCLSLFWAWFLRTRRFPMERARDLDVPPPSSLWEYPVAWLRWLERLPRIADVTSEGVVLPIAFLPVLILLGVLLYFTALASGRIYLGRWPRRQEVWADVVAVVVTGLAGGLGTWLALNAIFNQAIAGRSTLVLHPAIYVCLAVPVYCLIFFLSAAAFVAFTSRRNAAHRRSEQVLPIGDEEREWLARHSAWLLIAAIAWAAVTSLVLFGPMLLLESPRLLSALGGISGIIAFVGGRSALTPATAEKGAKPTLVGRLLGRALPIAAFLFIAVLIASLSLGTSALIATIEESALGRFGPEYRPQISRVLRHGQWVGVRGSEAWAAVTREEVWTPLSREGQLAILYQTPARMLFFLALILGVLGYGLSLLINLNQFSLHAAYRARLIRAFLGASRWTERQDNPFTGFDPQDNVQMHELRPGLLKETSFRPGGLARLVSKLREDSAGTPAPAWIAILRAGLDGDTQSLLRNHRDPLPPSQSLKRKLFEDLNHLLEAERLYEREHVADQAVSEHLQGLVRALWLNRMPDEKRRQLEARPTNRQLGDLTPPLGQGDALIILNRGLLDDAFPEELERLPFPPPPYNLMHVVNVALNLVGGERLAWQERKAAPFTISPLHCGSHYVGYRRAREYGGRDGITLGTAAAISGAALSSNMGYHSTSSAVTFVLTLFNARLGWWLGNPGIRGSDRVRGAFAFREGYPRSSISPLVFEAFGLTDDTRRDVLLSDGGHFDNLGLYEMVLRRCRYIVLVDGSQDPHGKFEDLGSAVRKIRIDLGIPIEFRDLDRILPDRDLPAKSGAGHEKGTYCAIGQIQYRAVDPGAEPGILIYIKPTMHGSEPADVRQYAATDPDFPHQSTLDQLFDESQFESYRALGSHAIDQLCGANGDLGLPELVKAIDGAHRRPGRPARSA
jgi:hypothetical protein